MDCWIMLLCSRLLSSSKICLKEIRRRPEKERGKGAENIRPVHDWHRRGGSYMDNFGHYARLMEELRVEDPVFLQLPQDGACHV